MSNRKLEQAIQTLFREVRRLYRSLSKSVIDWLLRATFVLNRRSSATAGFTLPLTVLLILVVSLSVGALTYRAFSRNTQVIVENQQRVLLNAATPAIDRARAKLEYLFDPAKDTRYPGGVPQESKLMRMLLNDGSNGEPTLRISATPGQEDPYTLLDETRIDIGARTGAVEDKGKDNAWSYRADTNGDGATDATVYYSVLFTTPPSDASGTFDQKLISLGDSQKAKDQVVRHGPLSNDTESACKITVPGVNQVEEGWFADPSNTSIIRKNFQVDAFVVPDNPKVAASTLEFHQDRQLDRGNKWGAWFRNDLEVFPGPPFRWNGAMHTEGSFLPGNNSDNTLQLYLISAKASCLFPPPENSEITVTRVVPTSDDNITFTGVVAVGQMGKDAAASKGSVELHVHDNSGGYARKDLTAANDSSSANALDKVYMDPSILLVQNKYATKETSGGPGGFANTSNDAWAAFNPTDLGRRIKNNKEQTPYVDDLYRADNRWGPKPRYGPKAADRVQPGRLGTDIVASDFSTPDQLNQLIGDTPKDSTVPENVGYDGYWERRAYNEGLRVLVSERLNLGNLYGWVTPRDLPANPATNGAGNDYINPTNTSPERDADPLYPPTVKPYPTKDSGVKLSHIEQQRRTLRDNLAAVQSAAIYHSAVNSDYPIACLAATNHPGTATTLQQAINFFPTSFLDGSGSQKTYLASNFFMGRGTNGWEFQPPGGSQSAFETDIANPNSALSIALNNLANFAGELDGAFPPKPNDTVVHPYPALTAWGNFSNLKRALKNVRDKGYARLSMADKSYIHTAACTLGMLAYNVDQVQRFDPTNPGNDTNWNANPKVLEELAQTLWKYMDGLVTNGEVLPKSRLNTYNYDPNYSGTALKYEARDYDNVPPEAYIALLRQDVGSDSPLTRMAELIMLNHQVRRDRTFGFRPSPAFGTFAIRQPSDPDKTILFPAACDPDQFALNPSASSNEMDLGLTPIDFSTPTNPIPVKLKAASAYSSSEKSPAALEPPGVVGINNITSTKKRLALSRLCGALSAPAGYNPADPKYDPTNAAYDPTAPKPTVLPKFPSLYYLFPEVAHGLAGKFQTDANNNSVMESRDYDARQPGHPDFLAPAKSNVTITAGTASKTINASKAQLVGANYPGSEVSYDREPYVVDPYVKTLLGAADDIFKPVQTGAVPTPLGQGPSPDFSKLPDGTPLPNGGNAVAISAIGTSAFHSRFPDTTRSVFPIADLRVDSLAIRPRQLDIAAGSVPPTSPGGPVDKWRLPFDLDYKGVADAKVNGGPNTPTNLIRVPRGTNVDSIPSAKDFSNRNPPTNLVAVPFLDRSIFNGRQLMASRVLDIDVGMLRGSRAGNSRLTGQRTGGANKFVPNDAWLPFSGIVYAFREDAVREDMIARPANTGTQVDVTNPASPTDPRVPNDATNPGISTKPISYMPDPDRRDYGFRLRNASQISRNKALVQGTVKDTDNVRGLSFFTDQSVYLQGDFNLHQDGGDDTAGNLLEEFQEKLRDRDVSDHTYYYNTRKTQEPSFAKADKDRWRPTEVLADSVTILSHNFCDGSAEDFFLKDNAKSENYKLTSNEPDNRRRGLFGPGCIDDGNQGIKSSFENSIIPTKNDLPKGFQYLRENASLVADLNGNPTIPGGDLQEPIAVSRRGEPLIREELTGKGANQRPLPAPVEYAERSGLSYTNISDGRSLTDGVDKTGVNVIVVSGINPSRKGQTYGGLHNFPRFLEKWNGALLFTGAFIQLNFSNYATSPFDQEALDPVSVKTAPITTVNEGSENIGYYAPPQRRWGYDVGLQFAPAAPAASRFVSPSTTRNEFYSEPKVNDPYISKLCAVAKANPDPNRKESINCPT